MPTSEGAQMFAEWWETAPVTLSSDPEEIAILAWNAGVAAACYHFGACEGVDHGAEKELHVEVA